MKNKLSFPNINYCWGHLIVEELIRQGVDYCCIAPGSRSSPLAVSIARHPKAKTFVHFDERGLGFHALGYAAATGKPVVLVCTSGTAVANFLPAVVEASKKKLPLIVLTADRPPELRQTGAVQTIDQVGIFGKYVTWAFDMPCPDINIKPAFVLTTVDQAMHQATGKRGVVHLNCMYREPLTPLPVNTDWPIYLKGLGRWMDNDKPYTTYIKAEASSHIFVGAESSLTAGRQVSDRINAIKQGIIAVGKIEGDKARASVLAIAKKLGWPIFADISSGLRLGQKDSHVIAYYDQVLLNPPKVAVDGVLHLGGRMTSKRFYEFIQTQEISEYIMVLGHDLRSDPDHQVSLRVVAGVEGFCKGIMPLLKPRGASALLEVFEKKNNAIDKQIDIFFKGDPRVNEAVIARTVSRMIPKNTGLYISNSMPIRDMDMYADPAGKPVHACGNRGASGIDGLIASAIGYAQGLKAPVTLMVGDLSVLHDLNSFAMLKDSSYPVIVILLNNGGGGIFSFLPIADERDVFEKLYGTPHPFTFGNAAAMFELNYAQPKLLQDFKKAYRTALTSSTSTIIEVITNREENLKVHRALQASFM